MKWRANFYDFSFKQTATAAIGIHPIKQRMECFTLLFNQLAWIEHQFLSGIRDSRKAGSLWGMMRGVGGVKKSIHQSWLAKGLGLWLLCWGSKGFRNRFGRKRPALFKSGRWHFHQDNAPVHNSILVTDYLTKMGIKTVAHPPYSPDLAIKYQSFVCLQFNGFKYSYLTLIILFNINHLFAHS